MKQVRRKMEFNKPHFDIDANPLTVVYTDPTLQGTKNDKQPSTEDMMKAIDRDDMSYDTLSQEFNEYVLDDSTRIRLYTNITKISRTKFNNIHGEPIYLTDVSSTMDIKLSNQYT